MKLDNRILSLRENVKQLSDKVLLDQTNYLAEHERGVSILVLRHLREIEVRRLFVELGYSSMYAYCIKHLKYSESKTMSRLASARLMTELPEIEQQIESGALNVTTLSKVQSFVRAEKAVQHELSKDEKLSLISECQDKSTREVAKELIQKSHQPALLAEKFQMTSVVLSDGSLDLEYSKFEALLDPENHDLLQEFKNLYAHDLTDGSNITVLTFLLRKAIQHKKKQLGLIPKKEVAKNPNATPPRSPKVTAKRKPLTVAVKRFVWQRASACCEHIDKNLGMRCKSKFALEPDHIVPHALGGADEADNLQLLCRVHNSRRAVKTFGVIRR